VITRIVAANDSCHKSAARLAQAVLSGLRLTSSRRNNSRAVCAVSAGRANGFGSFVGVVMKGSDGTIALRDELELGRRGLTARFRASPPRSLKAGEPLAAAGRSGKAIYHLIEGWACRFHSFSDGGQAIVDVYLPGDIIGLDTISPTRDLEGVIALTSIVAETIDVRQALAELMTRRSIAIYICWLLGQRQRRTERHVAAISSLDARGRMAAMALDFHTRLSRKRLITGSSYSLPLTQHQIASYLGLTVAHVNRVLRFLRDEQIVSLERHCMTILNLKQLKTLAQKGLPPIADFDKRSSHEPTPYRKSPYLNDDGFPVSEVAAANGFP